MDYSELYTGTVPVGNSKHGDILRAKREGVPCRTTTNLRLPATAGTAESRPYHRQRQHEFSCQARRQRRIVGAGPRARPFMIPCPPAYNPLPARYIVGPQTPSRGLFCTIEGTFSERSEKCVPCVRSPEPHLYHFAPAVVLLL